MKLSKKQEEANRIWTQTDKNLLVDSVAGSGKTTLIVGLAKKTPGKTLMLAFNKSIQTEMEEKIAGEGHLKAMTLHSLGLMTINNHLGHGIKINKSKNFLLTKKLREIVPSYFKSLEWKKQVEISACLSAMNDTARMFITEDIKEIKKFMVQMGKPMTDIPTKKIIPKTKQEYSELQDPDGRLTKTTSNGKDAYKISESILWELLLKVRNTVHNEIDFLDMIYIPIVMDMDIPLKPEYLTIDEAQDLNYCQHMFIDKIIAQPTMKKWLAVGDYRQSIYGFGGALSNSFDLFRDKDNVVETNLDICYRCDTKIIGEANKVYNVMTGFKSNPGVVMSYKSIGDVEFEENSMIICRNQAPLVELFFYLSANDVSCQLKGEDFIGNIINYLKPFKFKKYVELCDELGAEVASLKHKTNDADRIKYYLLSEKLEILMLIMANLDVAFKFIKDVIPQLEVLFRKRENAITLCTIHKSKGLESETIYWLYPELIPSKFAISQDQIRQEENLKYVAITRAKSKLFIINAPKKEEDA